MIEELGDRWIFDERDLPVEQVGKEGGFRTVISFAAGVQLTIDGPFQLTHGSGQAADVVALRTDDLEKLISAKVLSAVGFKSGSLRFVFSTGHHLNVDGSAPDARSLFVRPNVFEWVGQGGAGVLKVIESDAS